MNLCVAERGLACLPIYLTKNGTATLVIMDADAFGEEMSAHHAVHDHKRAYSRYHAQP